MKYAIYFWNVQSTGVEVNVLAHKRQHIAVWSGGSILAENVSFATCQFPISRVRRHSHKLHCVCRSLADPFNPERSVHEMPTLARKGVTASEGCQTRPALSDHTSPRQT